MKIEERIFHGINYEVGDNVIHKEKTTLGKGVIIEFFTDNPKSGIVKIRFENNYEYTGDLSTGLYTIVPPWQIEKTIRTRWYKDGKLEKLKSFESFIDSDPYGEEDWGIGELVDIKADTELKEGDEIYDCFDELYGIFKRKEMWKDPMDRLVEVCVLYSDKYNQDVKMRTGILTRNGYKINKKK
jgi:hypothetical protein